MKTLREIAHHLPDIPRWVEVRDLLLSGECEIFGLQDAPEISFVLRDAEGETVFVIGAPSLDVIGAVVRGTVPIRSVIAPQDRVAHLAEMLPGWTRTTIIIHSLRYPERLPDISNGHVDFLDPTLLDQLPLESELLEELKDGAKYSPIAATFVDNQPVSFCYSGSETETLWDVSIDTLPDYRQKGYAGLCATYMIRYMEAHGKQPVWQAVEENPASWRLAQKIGFVPVDELALFELPEEEDR